MAIGGLEGEFEVYCCMDQSPIKIWGTKFKGKNDVMLMTNAIQIVRLQHDQLYKHLLIACMNDAGVLIYQLPNHSDSHSNVILLHHIRAFDRVPINDAKLSSDGQNLVCVGDEACIFHLKLGYSNKQFTVTNPKKILIPSSILCSLSSPYSSQHLSWSKSSLYFAHTSDTHNFVLVWRTYPTLQMMYRIDSGGYAYAIEFHPQYETILAFTNRYGYLHTVDLSEAVSIHNPEQIVSVDKSSHTYNPSCPTTQTDEPIYHTMDLVARQEITMVSFRGQVNRKLRILAKINGIQWSIDGKYLYVSTKKRILAYRFMKSFNHVDTLEQMACRKTRAIMENYAKRKRLDDLGAKKKQKWNEKWNQIPEFIKEKAIADTHHLASH